MRTIKKRLPGRRKSLTVCLASISEGAVIGIADRMITAGDVEYEPQQSKLWPMTSSIVALVAGDYTTQAEILTCVEKDVFRGADNPQTWLSVREVADLYCRKYRDMLRVGALKDVLEPIGLDFASFLDRQAAMDDEIVRDIVDRLRTYNFDSELQVLFIGMDQDGPQKAKEKKLNYPHILAVIGGRLLNYDTAGFAAIGIGKGHAESQFMYSKYWRGMPFHEALLVAYMAKKRAEVAPGVGKESDIVVIGPDIGHSLKVEERHLAMLDAVYQRIQKSSTRTVKRAEEQMRETIDQIRREYAPA